jgi:hypothetical protein
VGDSTSLAYVEAFKKITASVPGWNVRAGGAFGCSFATVVMSNTAPIMNGCPAHNADIVSEIRASRPALVVVTDLYELLPAASTGVNLTDAQWSATLSAEIEKIKAYAGRILILAPAPTDKDVRLCYTRTSTPADCIGTVTPTFQKRAAAEKSAAAQLGLGYLDTRQWYCSSTGYCPAFVGSTPVKRDHNHITPAYADLIAPVMLESLQQAGYFTSTSK